MIYFIRQQIQKVDPLPDDIVDVTQTYLQAKESLDIKTVYKWILSPIVCMKYNCKAQQESNFTINFIFKNEELDKNEVLLFYLV